VGIGGIEADFTYPLGDRLGTIPPLHGPGEASALIRIEAEGLAEITQRAARTISDDRRADGRALAPIFPVDVLNDFLAPLVLEIDVDIGRLVALARDETLEEQGGAGRIDSRDM